MKTTTLGIFFLLAVNNVLAQGQHALHTFYFFDVTSPAGVVAAMDKWRNSKAGKSAPNTVVLIQNIVNGDYKSTHAVNVFYPNGAAMDASMAISRGSKGWAEFQATMDELAEPEWENMYSILRAKVNQGDISPASGGKE